MDSPVTTGLFVSAAYGNGIKSILVPAKSGTSEIGKGRGVSVRVCVTGRKKEAKKASRQAGKQTSRQAGKQAGKQASKQASKQAGKLGGKQASR